MRVRQPEGYTLIELLIVVAMIGIIAAIAVPGLLRARMSGAEASAISTLRVINSAEAAYSSAVGGGFAVTLVILAAPCSGATQGFISPDLALDPLHKSGYEIVLGTATGDAEVATDCNGKSSRTGYFATAEPISVGTTGQRSFSTEVSGTIRFDKTGVLMAEGDGNLLQ